MININEVLETNNMIEKENLDVRTITLGISLLDCIDSDLERLKEIQGVVTVAFESLSSRLSETLKKVRGQKTLTQENMDEMLREIRLALLEADVNFDVVREFIKDVKQEALGQEVLTSLTPGQMVVKIVHDEIMNLFQKDFLKLTKKDVQNYFEFLQNKVAEKKLQPITVSKKIKEAHSFADYILQNKEKYGINIQNVF